MTAAALTVIMISGCDKRQYGDYYIPGTGTGGKTLVNPGALTVKTDPTATDGTSLQEQGSDVIITDNEGDTLDTAPGNQVDLSEGTYTVTVISGKDGKKVTGDGTNGTVKVSGKTISVTPDTNGKLSEIPEVYGNTGNININENSSAAMDLKQSPLTRQIEIKLTIQGLRESDFTNATARVYGLAESKDVSVPFSSSASSKSVTKGIVLNGYYAETTSTKAETVDGKLVVTMYIRTLGIDTGKSQSLVITVKQKNGPEKSLEEDITNLLKNFNSGAASVPLEIDYTISFGLGNVTGSITGWGDGIDGDITGK